jgi:hypothetical protein
MLTADTNADLLNPNSWKKSAQPVFKQSAENKVYAPGHNSFFKSANGKKTGYFITLTQNPIKVVETIVRQELKSLLGTPMVLPTLENQ